MKFHIVIPALLAVGACAPQDSVAPPDSGPGIRVYSLPNNTEIEMVLTSADGLDQYDGMMITIQGVVSRSKVPHILGVEIKLGQSVDHEQFAQASGQLRKLVTTEEQAKNESERRSARVSGDLHGPTSGRIAIATRSAGVSYHLHDLTSNEVAVAHPWTPDSTTPADLPSAER